MRKKGLAKLVPTLAMPAVEKAHGFLLEAVEQLTGRDSMIPPESMNFVGKGDFEKIGREFKQYFIDLANIQPSDRILDVGCGIGRMAVPLTDYLSPEGEYWGFDIVQMGIRWCQRRISPKFPNFHFLHSDIKNKQYNRKGKTPADQFRFPFDDGAFDFVFLTSVFTHMLPADMEHYLSEIARVLKQGGRCLITFFLLNDESKKLLLAGRSSLDFKHEIQGCLAANAQNPEAAIAYEEDQVQRLFANYKLKIAPPIHYGSWCERDRSLSYQDIIVAVKDQ